MKRRLLRNRHLLLTILLGAGFLWGTTGIEWGRPLLHPDGLSTLGELLVTMVTPDLSAEILVLGLRGAWRTIVYATCGMTLAILVGFPLGILASGTITRHPATGWVLTGTVRSLLGGMRSIHELVWAWLFVAAFGLTPLAAVIAIAIPYGGILGRIFADLLNDVKDEPLRMLRSSGAGPSQTFFYGRLPQVFPDLVSYGFYRFECAIRSAAIMSFVGLGGLGYQIEVSLADLKFNQAWTFVYVLILLILAVNLWSSETRRALLQ